MSDGCNSRHFTWLTKSCFPNPHQDLHHPIPLKPSPENTTTTTDISSLPDDLLLECLSRVPHSSLPSISAVSRRWAHILHSSSFYHLRRSHGALRLTVFAVALSDSALFTATHRIDHDATWKIANDVVSCHGLFSHARLAAVGRRFYVIGRAATLRCDTWTGTVTETAATVFSRKKFAAAVVAGKIYVAGGSARSSAVEEYDPDNNTWRVVSDAPRRRYGCLGVSVDGVFYVIGGLKIGNHDASSSSRAGGSEAHVYASSMDLYDVVSGAWLRSRAVPGGGCVVAACSAEGHVYVLASHAVELSFWRFDGRRRSGGFGEWCRLKSPPLPAQVRLDSTVRFSCVGVGSKVVLIQVMGCIDDLLRRSGRSIRGLKEGLVLIHDCAAGEWTRGPDLPEVMRRAACVSVEC